MYNKRQIVIKNKDIQHSLKKNNASSAKFQVTPPPHYNKEYDYKTQSDMSHPFWLFKTKKEKDTKRKKPFLP